MLHDQIVSSLLYAIKLLLSCCLNIRWHSWPVTYYDLRRTKLPVRRLKLIMELWARLTRLAYRNTFFFVSITITWGYSTFFSPSSKHFAESPLSQKAKSLLVYRDHRDHRSQYLLFQALGRVLPHRIV
jgi:hypothetical protein